MCPATELKYTLACGQLVTNSYGKKHTPYKNMNRILPTNHGNCRMVRNLQFSAVVQGNELKF